MIVVIISADAEWRALTQILPEPARQNSPFGEWFAMGEGEWGDLPAGLLFFHGGWGKISAAASAQYVVDRWRPELLVNLGTCGGFEGAVRRGDILLVERTIVYDIIEQMGDFDSHIAHYSTSIDLSWLGDFTPPGVRRSLMVSGDRDLLPAELSQLKTRYGAIAGDWESGAIAWVAARSQTPCLILRGVTDLVGVSGGEAYGNIELFQQATHVILGRLVGGLSAWLALWHRWKSSHFMG